MEDHPGGKNAFKKQFFPSEVRTTDLRYRRLKLYHSTISSLTFQIEQVSTNVVLAIANDIA